MPVTVVNLPGVLPEPRYDGVPWTHALINEAAAPGGPWTQIDNQLLPAPDADPSQPAVRNFTTLAATLAEGWYAVGFKDTAGNISPVSDPVRNSSSASPLPPSPEAVRRSSPLLRQRLTIDTEPLAIADLRNLSYQATGLVQAITWRTIDPTLGCAAPEGEVCEAVPAALVPTALEAIARMAERIFVTTEPDFAEQAATGRRLRGFSAGPYSESYFAPGEFARRGASQGRPAMDQDDALDAALWALATEDARDYFVWRATGVAPPVGQAVGFDYRRQSIGYGAGSLGGMPGRSGPDGF